MSLILLGRTRLRKEPPLARWLKARYEAALARVVENLRLTALVFVMAVVAAFAVVPNIGEDLFPTFKERQFLLHWIGVPGNSIDESRRIVTKTSRQILAIKGIPHYGAHIGQARLGEEVVGPNFSESWISLAPNADYNQTTEKLRALETRVPGLFHDLQTYLRERIDETIAGTGEGFVVRIFGDKLSVLRREAAEVEKKLGGVKGLVDLHVEPQQDVPQVEVTPRLSETFRYGLKPGDVRRAASTFVAGEGAANVYRGGRVYEAVVRGIPEARRNVTNIQQLPIDTPGGGSVPLGRVASVRIAATPSDIKREQGSRRIDVLANIAGRNLGDVTSEAKKRLGEVSFPLGYHAELLGEAKEREAAQDRLIRYAAITIVAILVLLQAAFRAWRPALVLFVTLPAALVGGLLAAYIGVGVISLGALIGFYTVLGIAARNGIMMVSHFQHLERTEGEPFGVGLVLRGAKERLTPILMTAMATALAIFPLALSGDKPGQEIEHPMALVILGGLVTSTLVNLFVVPALYLRTGGVRDGDDDDRGVQFPDPTEDLAETALDRSGSRA